MGTKIIKCRICGNEDEKQIFHAKDNHFGLDEEFIYFECPNCETLQIGEIPQDMSKYYPEGYYSKFVLSSNPIKTFLKRMWYRSYSSQFNLSNYLMKMIKGKLPFTSWLGEITINLNDPILDIGSGTGNLLYHLNLAGFNDLTGIDPFINESLTYSKELRIIKGNLEDLIEQNLKYKLLLFNYSFEHIANPLETLRNSRKLQNRNDDLIIRIPVSNSYAWKKYGTNWANLDAPRHFHIFSEKSMSLLAEKSGYKIDKIVYDSDDFPFWLSTLYQNNIPFTATEFGSKNPMKDFRHLVSRKESRAFKKLARELNQRKEGDQATFYLRAK